MSDADQGHPLVSQLADHIEHFADHLGVEGGGGLVKQHQLGLHAEGAGDGDPLLLAAGELVWVLVGLCLNAHPLEQPERPGFGLLRAQPQGMHRCHHQVFQHRHMWEEVELLKHHANPTLQAAQVGRGHRLAKQEQLAVVDPLQPVDGADQGRFSRA